MHQKLSIPDLVQGLESFRGKYNALDVFADDVAELLSAAKEGYPDGWSPLEKGLFQVHVAGKPYYVRVFDDAGVVRVAREPERVTGRVGTGGAVGALAGAAIVAATSKKGEGLVGGALLGLLVGAALGAATGSEPAPHRVFTMQFDPLSRQWKAYTGGLVRWMKSELSSIAA